ncbi:MAG: PIN domain-containing protein [Phycisphaeraceae bacterium]
MILLDASVLIPYLKTGSPTVEKILDSVNCGICGVTRAEILHGARTPQDAQKLCSAIDELVQVQIHPDTWDHLGSHLALLRQRGLPIPFQDVLLATVAIEHDAELWSHDSHFRVIQGVLPQLRLFVGPTE